MESGSLVARAQDWGRPRAALEWLTGPQGRGEEVPAPKRGESWQLTSNVWAPHGSRKELAGHMERPAPAPQGATGRYRSRRCQGCRAWGMRLSPSQPVPTSPSPPVLSPLELSQAATGPLSSCLSLWSLNVSSKGRCLALRWKCCVWSPGQCSFSLSIG